MGKYCHNIPQNNQTLKTSIFFLSIFFFLVSSRQHRIVKKKNKNKKAKRSKSRKRASDDFGEKKKKVSFLAWESFHLLFFSCLPLFILSIKVYVFPQNCKMPQYVTPILSAMSFLQISTKKIISYNIKRMKCFKCKSFTNYEILKNKNWNYQERKLSVNSGHKLYLVVSFYPL